MAGKEKPRRSKRARWLGRILLFAAAAVAAVIGYDQIKPLLEQGTTWIYEPYTVQTGDVRTSMSMSGAISVGAQETITNQSAVSSRDLLTVREIFVETSQRVEKDDKLIQLSNGDIYRAGIDGTVNEIRVSKGDRVRANATLMDICDVDNLIVTIGVDEYDVSKVAIGQPCTITVLPLDVQFETRIGHIDRVSNAMGRVASYTVTADVDAPEDVWPGMQASVSIPQHEAIGVPVLAMEAISFDEDGTPYVLNKTGEDTYERVPIEVGLSDGMQVQIISGLSSGDTVWAQTDAVQSEPTLSLSRLYRKIFGEKVVIIDRTGSGMSRGGRSGMSRSDDLGMTENREMPGASTPGEAAGGFAGMPGASTPGEAGTRERRTDNETNVYNETNVHNETNAQQDDPGRQRPQAGGDGA